MSPFQRGAPPRPLTSMAKKKTSQTGRFLSKVIGGPAVTVCCIGNAGEHRVGRISYAPSSEDHGSAFLPTSGEAED